MGILAVVLRDASDRIRKDFRQHFAICFPIIEATCGNPSCATYRLPIHLTRFSGLSKKLHPVHVRTQLSDVADPVRIVGRGRSPRHLYRSRIGAQSICRLCDQPKSRHGCFGSERPSLRQSAWRRSQTPACSLVPKRRRYCRCRRFTACYLCSCNPAEPRTLYRGREYPRREFRSIRPPKKPSQCLLL